MDINESLQPIVAGLLDNLKVSIEAELKDKISAEVISKVAATEFDSIIAKLVEQQLSTRLERFNFVATTNEALEKIVLQLTDQFNNSIAASANAQVLANINQRLSQVDLNAVINNIVANKLSTLLQNQQFPPGSISQESINFAGLLLSGNYIKGGIIENFGSTGIEDRATGVQMTLLDTAVVFESPLFVPKAEIKGDLTVDGSLVVLGKIDTNTPMYQQLTDAASDKVKAALNKELFTSFSEIIFDKIKTEGLDLDKITQSGKEVVKGNQLGYHIVDSNLQRVGMLRDLQTVGEAYLSETLYSTKGRVGINTMDPTAALSIWDQEVEITISKRQQDMAYIATPRFQSLILGANNKDNLKLLTDGTVQADNLTVGKVPMTSSHVAPNTRGQRGQIVWNEVPNLGGPMGWVCLGDTVWANFGIID